MRACKTLKLHSRNDTKEEIRIWILAATDQSGPTLKPPSHKLLADCTNSGVAHNRIWLCVEDRLHL